MIFWRLDLFNKIGCCRQYQDGWLYTSKCGAYHGATSSVMEIKNEYSKIDENWLSKHFRVAMYLSIFAFLVESLLSFNIFRTNLITTSNTLFFLKYLIIPSIFNFVLLLVGIYRMRYSKISQTQRIYTVSFMLTIFVLF